MSKSILCLLLCSIMIQVIMANPATSAARQFNDVLPKSSYGEGCDKAQEKMSVRMEEILTQAATDGSSLLEQIQDVMQCGSGVENILKCIGKAVTLPVYAAGFSLSLLWALFKFAVSTSYSLLVHCIFGFDFALGAVALIA